MTRRRHSKRRNDFRQATAEEIAAENRRVKEALLHQPVKPPRKITPANPKAVPRVARGGPGPHESRK